jgi:hypothetical protein
LKVADAAGNLEVSAPLKRIPNLRELAPEGDSRDEEDKCDDTDVAQNEARDSHPAPSLSPIRLLDLVERDMPEDHGKD